MVVLFTLLKEDTLAVFILVFKSGGVGDSCE